MSRAVESVDVRADQVVISRSQYADVFHRPAKSPGDPEPACQQAAVEYNSDYRKIDLSLVATHYEPCQNPGCFGSYKSRLGQIWPVSISDRPIRLQAFHVVVQFALSDQTPFMLRDVREVLALNSRSRSMRRGVRDAVDAGWVDRDGDKYVQGALAADLGGERP